MIKSKVGAEPKKRIKHVFGKHEGIHEGIYRDEPGWYNSKYHPYCFAYGYFFHRSGNTLGKKLTPDYIKDNWDREMWCRGIGETCIAVIDRDRKIAVLNNNLEYACNIRCGLPDDYLVYELDCNIPCYDITSPKNKKILIKAYLCTLIRKYINCYQEEYKVIHTISKYNNSCNVIKRTKLLDEINKIVSENKWLPKVKPLDTNNIFIKSIKIPFPSLRDILNDNLFTREEKITIKQSLFYTKYCYNHNIPWKDVVKNWNTKWTQDIIDKDSKAEIAFQERIKRYKELAEKNKRFARTQAQLGLNDWRKDTACSGGFIEWTDYYFNTSTRTITPITRHIPYFAFLNTQLRLKPNKPNWVETSRGAVVPLDVAINIFNQLYNNYILSGKTEFEFKPYEFKIGSFYVSRCAYVGKYSDSITVTPLGYKEWLFTIGCHRLWFDDIKDFARYYNLQDRLSFPLDKTTAECMENHLIHLSSGKTISAVGTINV